MATIFFHSYMLTLSFDFFQTQEKEAKEHMKRMARELQQQRKDAMRGGGKRMGGMSGIGSQSMGRGDVPIIDSSPTEPTKPSYTAPR